MTAGFMSDNYWPDRRPIWLALSSRAFVWALDLWNGINIFNCLTSCMPLFINFSPHPFLSVFMARKPPPPPPPPSDKYIYQNVVKTYTYIYIYTNRYWIYLPNRMESWGNVRSEILLDLYPPKKKKEMNSVINTSEIRNSGDILSWQLRDIFLIKRMLLWRPIKKTLAQVLARKTKIKKKQTKIQKKKKTREEK